eukprot:TRINITY_DN16885_c0_g1_i1.p1 TRINITY_DN16885_c0_g1~~TRINITY_DN16885_c0_g1_i1.p1  ORF type:complete len:286 (+),score=16.90 TRINITY_DN16885_c0_g1_i1:35-892(+)
MGNIVFANRDCGDGCASGLFCVSPWRRGDLVVSGVRPRFSLLPTAANGAYILQGEHHGCPVYGHERGGFYIYYWDDRDGPTWCGWWLGNVVGSATVWAYSDGRPGATPPSSGWHVPWNGPIDSRLRFRSRASSFKTMLESPVPKWLSCAEPLEQPVDDILDSMELHTCCICLEPLWKARPSVFLVNLKRLCPHYFCYECAQRVMRERTNLVKVFEERMRLALVDGLPVVIDVEGEQVGDLVWKHNGERVTEGEFCVMIAQLGRFEMPGSHRADMRCPGSCLQGLP